MYLKAVVSVFQSAVDETITSEQAHLELNEPQFNPDTIPARKRLLTHQRKLVANILRWRKYCGPLFGVDQLLERLVGEGMLPIAESGWDVGGAEAMREVRILWIGMVRDVDPWIADRKVVPCRHCTSSAPRPSRTVGPWEVILCSNIVCFSVEFRAH